jgi:O-antigen ligase
LGGGTRSGFLSDVILQIVAVPLLVWALWRLADVHASSSARLALFACAAIAAVPLLQLIPLSPALWTALPNRAPVKEAFELTDQPLPWMPLSADPNATALSALSLLVPTSIFLATVLLGRQQRRSVSLVLLGAGVVSVFVGLSQVAQGPSSSLRFFDFSNTSEAIGFFANRNHFAALLYCMTILAAAWALEKSFGSATGAPGAGRAFTTANVVAALASFTILVALVSAQAMARSRAGLGLTIVALIGAFALAFSERRATSGLTPTRIFVVAILLAGMFATQFALYRIMERFADDPLKDARIAFARSTIEAAKSFMPLGSGMGSFVPVYALFEKPQDVLANTFANRAHNDVLELWLESGVLGIGLMAAFLGWFVLRCVAVWRSKKNAEGLDRSLARAATLIVGLLLLHSFVDYPLRTAAMMAIFAFACGLLVDPPDARDSGDVVKSNAFIRDRDSYVPATAVLGGIAPGFSPEPTGLSSSQPKTRQWGEESQWPEEWRRPSVPIRPRR